MYLLLYDLVPDYLERRVPLREEHLKLVRAAHARGEIAIAGAFDDPADGTFDGVVFVFDTDDRALVQRFAEADPYVQHGLVTRWRVRHWNVVVGGSPAR